MTFPFDRGRWPLLSSEPFSGSHFAPLAGASSRAKAPLDHEFSRSTRIASETQYGNYRQRGQSIRELPYVQAPVNSDNFLLALTFRTL
jgi:hypothetical protein